MTAGWRPHALLIGFATIFIKVPQRIAGLLIKKAANPTVIVGILMMTIVTLGSMTPPVGVCMYAVCSVLNCRIEADVKGSLPFQAAVVVLILLLLFVPQLVLFLPNLAFGQSLSCDNRDIQS